MAKPKQVSYYDPDGQEQTGWYQNGHVYTDEAATNPIPSGSTFRSNNGSFYRQTKYGGILWATPRQTDKNGAWLPQGNPWYRQAQDLLVQQQNRPAFSYDPEQDAFWQSAKDQTLRQGQKAMEDTIGKASALTGGYASSYAQNLGQQSYRASLGELGKLLPELYDRAKSAYDSETKRLLSQIDEALGLYDKDYQIYLDAQAADRWRREFDRDNSQWARELAWEQEQWNRDFDRDNDHWARELNWAREQWNREFDRDNEHWWADFDRDNEHWAREMDWEQEQWNRDFDRDNEHWLHDARQAERERADRQQAREDSAAASRAEQERSYAYKMAMLALRQGLPVSAELLETAGIDADYAERLRRHYANLLAQQNKP